MDIEFLSAVRALPLRREAELKTALSELLTRTSGEGPLTIKGVRDRFSAVNRLAKSGQIQVVKGTPGDETVIVSMNDLAAIIRAAAASMSFTDALAVAGFVPIKHRLLQSEGFKRDETLVLDSVDDSAVLDTAADPESAETTALAL
jgi:hypothetical protein